MTYSTAAADDTVAIKAMPWGVILMVCGVTVLIALLEKTQGMSLFTDLLASVSSPGTVSAVVAFATGLVSVYSSTSGVVTYPISVNLQVPQDVTLPGGMTASVIVTVNRKTDVLVVPTRAVRRPARVDRADHSASEDLACAHRGAG